MESDKNSLPKDQFRFMIIAHLFSSVDVNRFIDCVIYFTSTVKNKEMLICFRFILVSF